MHNLERIHSRFFPKSRTAPWGKKLIYLAWGIEILVACVSLAIAYLFNFTDLLAERGPDTYVIVLALVVVAAMEITKIPLAIALYYSTRWIWRTLFILLLLFANYSTFETIIQAFDLSYYNRILIVDEQREKIENTREDLKLLSFKLDTNKLDNDIERLNNQLSDALNNKSKIETDRSKELTLLKDEYSVDNSVLASIKEKREKKEKQLEAEKILKSQAQDRKTNTKITGVFGGLNAVGKSLERDIKKYDDNISKFEREIEKLDREYQNALRKTSGKDEGKQKIIDKKYDALLAPIDQSISKLNESIKSLSVEKENVSKSTESINNQIKAKKEILIDQEKEAKKLMQANPIYRITLRIKNRATWLGGDDQTYKITEVNQEDLDFAFTIWFGGLALVIAVIGTGVALAGLHLQDEKMHELRNKPVKRHFVRVPILINKYIWESIKRLFKPKIKTVEVEVEKIVEKIIEKPVVEEKIVIQKVEVPKEVEKKVFVHVPFPTDDPEVIKKGPMIYNDKDKDKK